MRIQGRRSINGVISGLIVVLIVLLVLGIVTGNIIFYILMGIIILLVIVSVIGLFTFLKKTGLETSGPRKSTYDILKSKDIESNLATKWEKGSSSSGPQNKNETDFCQFCGMKLDPGVTMCTNCGKSTL